MPSVLAVVDTESWEALIDQADECRATACAASLSFQEMGVGASVSWRQISILVVARERVDVYAVLCGRISVDRVTPRSTAATAARTAPYANGAPGPTLSQSAPATRLAGRSAAPVAVA